MNNCCRQCGKEISNDSGFCGYCGNKNIIKRENVLENKGLKVSSLIIGIISIVFSIFFNVLIIPLAIVGLVLGIIYSKKVKKICAGIVLNIIGIIISLVVLLLLIYTYNYIIDSVDNLWDDYNYNENNSNNTSSSSDNRYDNTTTTEEHSNEENQYTSNNKYFNETYLNDVINWINNKEDFILVVSQIGCSHCINFKPKIGQVAMDNKIYIYYIEYDLLSESEKNMFNEYMDLSGTPTTMFFIDGVENIDAKMVGNNEIYEIESVLRNNGYIK